MENGVVRVLNNLAMITMWTGILVMTVLCFLVYWSQDKELFFTRYGVYLMIVAMQLWLGSLILERASLQESLKIAREDAQQSRDIMRQDGYPNIICGFSVCDDCRYPWRSPCVDVQKSKTGDAK
jgi:hypothetical protein